MKLNIGWWAHRISGAKVESLAAGVTGELVFQWPACFVLGPPRSGSTLLTQVLTDAFNIAYISNTHCRWYGAPWAAEKWLRPLESKQVSDFVSHHGRTTRPFDPAECAKWWYRFFRREPAYATAGDVEQIRSIHALLDGDFERLGVGCRMFRVRYEEFCRDVHGTLERFERVMATHGVTLRKRFEVPESFTVTSLRKIPEGMFDELCRYVGDEAANRTDPGGECGAGGSTP